MEAEVSRIGTLKVHNPDDMPMHRKKSNIDALRRTLRAYLTVFQGVTPRSAFEEDMMSTGSDGRQPLIWQ
jgi:hypothetical protein